MANWNNKQVIQVGGWGSGDMTKAVYDTDNDGVVDASETVRIIVRNSTGATLTKWQVVYLQGATWNRPNALLADASTEATSSKTIGMVIANIANNADGYVATNGTLHDFDLSAFADGDRLWLSETAWAMVANTPPAEPAHSVFIGTVARAHPTQGRIVLAIQNGYELNELHGVQISNDQDGDVLQYEASSGLWKNKSQQTFETVSKNLKGNPYALNYTSGNLTSIVYTLTSGTITKTLNYTGGKLTSIVLSGNTPSGINLTKTLSYTGDTLTSITYS